jgi:monofunctional biosynthetic peptidoglycan transglycosylase
MSVIATRRPAGGGPTRVLRRIVILLIVLLLLPYAIIVLYRVVTPVSTPMLWRWITGQRVERLYVPLGMMQQSLPLAVIAAEDARFCSHAGIDWRQVQDAIEDADDITEARGGSTLTQQVAKNLFLWPGRSLVRKALEVPLAYWIDLVLGKRRVMEIYLNIAEWGPNGEFGAEAGARYALGKSVRTISPTEAALLAAILPNPKRRSARQPGPSVRRLAGIYLGRAQAGVSLAACLLPRRRP